MFASFSCSRLDFLVAAGAVAGWFVRPAAASWTLRLRPHALAIWVVSWASSGSRSARIINRKYVYTERSVVSATRRLDSPWANRRIAHRRGGDSQHALHVACGSRGS